MNKWGETLDFLQEELGDNDKYKSSVSIFDGNRKLLYSAKNFPISLSFGSYEDRVLGIRLYPKFVHIQIIVRHKAAGNIAGLARCRENEPAALKLNHKLDKNKYLILHKRLTAISQETCRPSLTQRNGYSFSVPLSLFSPHLPCTVRPLSQVGQLLCLMFGD